MPATPATRWDRWAAEYATGTLTWADLLEISGLTPHGLYITLDRYGLINP